MSHNLKNSKIVFVDDDAKSVEQYVKHLKKEGYTNTHSYRDASSYSEAIGWNADIVFLDITGVGKHLDPSSEGASLLGYFKKHQPWIPIIVLSGQEFDVERIPDLAMADKFIRKSSLSNSDLVLLTEELLEESLSPEKRNPKILREILNSLDDANISWWTRHRAKKTINNALKHENDPSFNWSHTVDKLNTLLQSAAKIAAIIHLLAK